MIIQIERSAGPKEVNPITELLSSNGFSTAEVNTQMGRYIVAVGKDIVDPRLIGSMKSVHDVHMISDPYQLVSAKWKLNTSQLHLDEEVTIGGSELMLMAGPCSIESEEQIVATLDHLEAAGIQIMRGGVFKPRSSPYSFRGIGLEGLKLWSQLAKERGIKIISEVMDVEQIEWMYDYVDIFQVGARNTQNFNLLDALGKVDKAVMIKRGISGSIEELLQSAEYVFSGGNEKLLLCERGIRTFETASRNTLDINAIPILKEKSHLPVIADPSHGIGLRHLVDPVARACVAAGADGVIYETHPIPEEAFSDGQQTLDFQQSSELVDLLQRIRAIHPYH